MSKVATIAAIRRRRSNTRNLRVDGAFARDKVVVTLMTPCVRDTRGVR